MGTVEMFSEKERRPTSLELLKNGATANHNLPKNIFFLNTPPSALNIMDILFS
jgi:hypothetical protein